MELIVLLAIAAFVLMYRSKPKDNQNMGKYASKKMSAAYQKYAPYSYQSVKAKAKELGQEYTTRSYITQIVIFAGFAGLVGWVYFYNIFWCIFYACIAVAFIPYLAYLKYQRVYSEFIFEQIQTYCTNVIMEFNTTQSFVKSLEGVRDSGILEDPVLSDLSKMIDMSYENGTIDQSIEYFNQKYPYYMVKNMHQLFYQITKEGARDAGQSLENMSQDIDALVEGVYRDQMDRKSFHGKFVTYGVCLFFLVIVIQFMIQKDEYLKLIQELYVQALLHAVIVINAGFLLKGEKYYNSDVGAE